MMRRFLKGDRPGFVRAMLMIPTGGFAGLAALLCPAVALPARSVAPSAAPAEWLRYAEAATALVTERLQADNERAVRLRTYLDATRPAPDQPTAPLILKLWVEADGRIGRIDFPAFAHAEPNADLRALVIGQRLPAPPKAMLLPMRISVQLEP